MKRKPVIAANWKMYKTGRETMETCRELLRFVGTCEEVEVVVCPPFTSLAAAAEVLRGSRIGLGAQAVHWEDEGAYTSQISLQMLVEAGCSHVIIGHSECRQYLAETDETVNRKVKKVLTSDLTPIVCVGESLESRQAGKVREVVVGQVERALSGLTPEMLFRIIVAYEPIWAIGTGHTATPETAQEVHGMIRAWLRDRAPRVADGVRIQYGGSVKPANIEELMAEEDIDGALVGGASLDARSFGRIVRYRD